MSIVEIENLSKHFRVINRRKGFVGMARDLFKPEFTVVKAVDDITLTINAGEVVGYIGPNGAGKSTTIKMMTGILKPTSGKLVVNDRDPYKKRQENTQYIGVIFGQRTQLWWDLPVVESFDLLREIYRVEQVDFDHQIQLFNDLIDLKSLYSKPVRSLSLGQRMLCDIVAAFIHNPKIVFLDEPTIGLDISVKAKIRDVIRTLNQEHQTTIILTTHDISDIEALCQRTIIIDKGKILYDGDTSRVNQLFGRYRTLRIQHQGQADDLLTQLQTALDGKFGSEARLVASNDEAGWTVITVNQDRVPLLDVLHFAMEKFKIKDVEIAEISMENVVKRVYDGALE